MRTLILMLIGSLLVSSPASAQNMSGQWTGGFGSSSDMWGGRTEYVLELEVRDDAVEGHSYTYFSINGKRCYVICKLKGSYDKGSKSISVTEVAKVKSNTPPDFRDCLQIHELTFFKQGEKEVLKGKWRSATTKENCGTGSTELERKALVKVTPVQPPAKDVAENKPPAKKEVEKTAVTKPSSATKKPTAPPAKKPAAKSSTAQKTTPPPANKPKTTSPQQKTVAKTGVNSQKPKKDSTVKVEQPLALNNPRPKEEEPQKNIKMPSYSGKSKLEARNKNIIKTIEVPEPEFTVNLYDNGQVDGDTVTLYFNGKLIASKQRLSTSPISIKIKIDPNQDENDLVMIAENLGSIPPNTALMVVTVGDKRYEVNITSTEQVNGTVRFKLRE
jgi:hypothetical protein